MFKVEDGIQSEELQIPCGQCYGCRLEKSRIWAIRCMHEARMHEDNWFLTLTYSQEELCKIRPYNSLVKSHLQKFWKRLRKAGYKFRYFACGEYGDKSDRPHYHAIVFGLTIPDPKYHCLSNDNKLYTSETLTKIWNKGHVILGNVSFDSCAYVARYCIKKRIGKKHEIARFYERLDPETGELWQVEPEFQTTSRGKPGGIGIEFYRKYKEDMFKAGVDGKIIIRGGKTSGTPVFYEHKFEEESEENFERLEFIKAERRKYFEEHADELTRHRLDMKEKIAKKRATKMLPRKLA